MPASPRLWLLPSLLSLSLAAPASSTPITPAPDGTNTQITPDPTGTQLTITGGTQTQTNLFHSFDQFNLPSGHSATFLTDPTIQNVLGRITGGSPSTIDGLLQISGSTANLYLLNPAGLLFGPNAQLNLGGSFYGSTASALGWSGQLWDSSSTNYNVLVGSPNQFVFTGNEGAIVNAANLSVNPGQDLALIGNSVINTGSLSAPGGEILLLAVPNAETVRLSQPGMLLSLEIEPTATGFITANSATTIDPLSLPQLLTQSDIGNATGLAVTPEGQILLTGSGLRLDPTPGLTAITGNLNSSSISQGGSIGLLGTQVIALSGELQASGDLGGGKIWIGGNYKGEGNLPNASQTFIGPEAQISANATLAGSGGQVIVWADDSTRFYGSIAATGGPQGGNGGFVEVSGKEYLTYRGSADVSAAQGQKGQLLLDPSSLSIIDSAPLPGTGSLAATPSTNGGTLNATDADAGANTVSWSQIGGSVGVADVILEATGDITIAAPLTSPAISNNLVIRSTQGSIRASTVATPLLLYVGELATVTLSANGDVTLGNVTLTNKATAQVGNLQITSLSGNISVGNIQTSYPYGSGDVTLTALAGNIQFASIDTSNGSGFGGDVTLATNRGVVQGTGTAASGATIDTSSVNAAGNITITHGGGPNNWAFQVGLPTFNGTAGALNAAGSITPGSVVATGTNFEMQPSGGTDNPQNNISITSVNSAPTLSATTLNIGVSNSPITFTLAGLSISDADGDNTALQITEIPSGTLTDANGNRLNVGDTITTSQTLIYNPPNGATGTGLSAFRVQAVDVRNSSPTLATSSPSLAIYDVATRTNTTNTGPNPDDRCGLEDCTQPVPVVESELSLEAACSALDKGVAALDSSFSKRFEQHFGLSSSNSAASLASACQTLSAAAGRGEVPGVIYISFSPGFSGSLASQFQQQWPFPSSGFLGQLADSFWPQLKQIEDSSPTPDSEADFRGFTPQPSDQLELILVTPDRSPLYYRSNVTRRQVIQISQQLRREVSDPNAVSGKRYLAPAQRLYDWLIRPLEPALTAAEINNLVFVLDEGIRTLPLAALHNGEDFIIRDYSVGLVPSLRLTESINIPLNRSSQQVLAMGASDFIDQNALPAVPLELSLISQQLWRGPQPLLNQDFTRDRVQQALQSDYSILHLATHAEIQSGSPENSYLQLTDTRLSIPELRQLLLNSSGSSNRDLMILSACRTAIDSNEAELGFAGLAFGAGVNTALASLWYVSDAGTLALMSGFYDHLGGLNPETRKPYTKADALRAAQLAMVQGEVRLEDNSLTIPGLSAPVPLPDSLAHSGDLDLSHPYFWAAFTMVGNPW